MYFDQTIYQGRKTLNFQLLEITQMAGFSDFIQSLLHALTFMLNPLLRNVVKWSDTL